MKTPLAILVLGTGCALAAEPDSFRSKVAPALEAKCVSCHRPDNLKGGLDLSTRETILSGGDDGSDLVVGKPEASEIFTRAISHDGKKPKMPKKGEALTPDEAEALRAWIAAGASWPEKFVLKEKAKADKTFWSFQPLTNAEPPSANDAPAEWRANPIDRFVFAKLAEKNLKPNAPADARAFIRRATYDLTGLPPTPEEVEQFVREMAGAEDKETRRGGEGENGASVAPSPPRLVSPSLPRNEQVIERLIDRLLASPRYGEHWGRHWLDVVRFGESRGFERNQIIENLWPFRDYVIRSFNEDRPFDQLVHEHLAGDVIGKNQPDVEVGSAFLVAGPYDDVGNQDAAAAAQIRADTLDEMIRTTSEAFLGVTLGCARCHDHKFDPLATKDYYAMAATFAGTAHGERAVATADAERAHAGKKKPLEAEKARLTGEHDTLQKALDARAKAAEPELAKKWTRPKSSGYGTEERFEPIEARYVRLVVEGSNSTSDKKGRRFTLDEFEVWTAGDAPRNVALAANGGQARGEAREIKDFAGAYSAALTIDGKFGERWQPAGNQLIISLAKPERIARVFFSSDRTHQLEEGHFITAFVGDYRIEVSLDGKHWQEVANSKDREPATPARKQTRLLAQVTTQDESARLAALTRDIARVDAELAKIPALPTWWVGTHRDATGPFHVFLGGSPQRLGDAVQPASLSVFDGGKSSYHLDAAVPEGERRVALAKWITAPENPLPSRVLANRVWHYHFGTGIVDTPSDFGYMGGRPTHPELLDWLARQLVAGGWKLKPLHRLIMTSQAYRQSGAWNETAAHADSDSRLLWRFPPRRFSAEEVRDTVLSVAGKLDTRMGGPGFRLYEYQQDNVATYVPLDAHGPETYRRAVYHHNARAARVDVMTDFDCPDPSFSEPRRASTTTPLQALTLMNHRFALDMAAALAARLEHDAGDSAARVRRAFALCYARDAGADEIASGVKLIEAHSLRAFCRAMLNTTELITLN